MKKFAIVLVLIMICAIPASSATCRNGRNNRILSESIIFCYIRRNMKKTIIIMFIITVINLNLFIHINRLPTDPQYHKDLQQELFGNVI